MGFQHPHQQAHKLAGMAAAAKSPNTPQHLRSHLQSRTQEGSMKINNLRKPDGKVPQISTLRSTSPADVSEQKPTDSSPFTTQGNDHSPMGTKVGKVTKQPSPAGTRPMSVTANLPKRSGPGIVHSQGNVRNARPAAKGLNQRIGLKRPNSSRRGPGLQASVRPVIKGQNGPGLQKTASLAKTRNMRGPGANPAFYGDF